MNSQPTFYERLSPEDQKAFVAFQRHVFLTFISNLYNGIEQTREDIAFYISGYQNLPDHIDTYAKVHFALNAEKMIQPLVNMHKMVRKEVMIDDILDIIQKVTESK